MVKPPFDLFLFCFDFFLRIFDLFLFCFDFFLRIFGFPPEFSDHKQNMFEEVDIGFQLMDGKPSLWSSPAAKLHHDIFQWVLMSMILDHCTVKKRSFQKCIFRSVFPKVHFQKCICIIVHFQRCISKEYFQKFVMTFTDGSSSLHCEENDVKIFKFLIQNLRLKI